MMAYIGMFFTALLGVLSVADSRIFRTPSQPASGGVVAWCVIVFCLCFFYLIWGFWSVVSAVLHINLLTLFPAFWVTYAISAAALLTTASLLVVTAVGRLIGKTLVPTGMRLSVGIVTLLVAAAEVVLFKLSGT
jgi:hypothetical protein